MGSRLDDVLGVLNGALGDYLARTHNGLATQMELFHRGAPLAVTREAILEAHGDVSPKIVLLVSGLMCTEAAFAMEDGEDFGSLLAEDLDFTPLYLRYNTGLAIPDNGEELARLLDALIAAYPAPIEEILLLGFSMGGLVVRSACHVASERGLPWLSHVRRAVYVGTPHLGAPLERAGRVLTKLLRAVPDPYTRLIADIGDLRSDGVKDLGDADLRHEDRARRRTTLSLRDPRHPVPLLPQIQHYLVAGSLSTAPLPALFFGDPMVPVASATNGHVVDAATLALPPDHVKIFPGMAHLTLPRDRAVYAQIRAFLDVDAGDERAQGA
jgi:hypothetical protein